MNEAEMIELERILADEEELQPMTGFSTRVMRAVREEATVTTPIAFPWARFLPGFLLNLGLFLAAIVWVLVESGSSSRAPLLATEWISDSQMQGLFWAALTVVGAGPMAWAVSKWIAPQRTGSF